MSNTQYTVENSNNKNINSVIRLVFGNYVVSQLLRLTSNLILTRLLVPEMFGVMALAFTFIYIINMLSDVGISGSLIQNENAHKIEFLNTAWTFQIFRGLFIAILILTAAYSLHLYGEINRHGNNSAILDVQLPLVLAALALTSIISGFNSTKLAMASRNLNLNKVVYIEITTQIIALFIMVSLAYYYKTIWSLVAGSLVSSFLICLASHVLLAGHKNRLSWNIPVVKEIWRFGKWVLVSSLMTGLLNQGDKLILGSIIFAKELGIYSIAIIISTAATQLIQQINHRVFFPKFSQIYRKNPGNLKSAYYKVRWNTDAIAFSVAGLLFILGPLIVDILFDSRYAKAGTFISILCLELIYSSLTVSKVAYLSVGKPKYNSLLNTFETIVKLTLVYVLAVLGGVDMAIYAMATYGLVILPLDYYFKSKINCLDFKQEFKAIPFLLLGLLAGVFIKWLLSF